MKSEITVDDTLVSEVIDSGFTFVTGVPDSALASFCRALERHHYGDLYIPGTREDNCVAMAAGACLAGHKSLVFMKSAGLGNCVDALTSLVAVYRIPMVILVSWAGYAGRDVPHHNVIGELVVPLLSVLDIPAHQAALEDPQQMGFALRAALAMAHQESTTSAVLGIPRELMRDGA